MNIHTWETFTRDFQTAKLTVAGSDKIPKLDLFPRLGMSREEKDIFRLSDKFAAVHADRIFV
jgi:hypothetical protein